MSVDHGLMKKPKRLLLSQSNDPYINLAFENYLFKMANLPCLFLYRNRPCVVIGRNQNPWMEADLAYLTKHNIELIRRYSGGGTVYHDMGNTNYSFMMPRAMFDRDLTANIIISGLRTAGLDVALNARHDITYNDNGTYKKCSGSAYKISKDRAYAHGTMLLRSDLDSLGPALRPQDAGITGNGVESVRSKVTNLGLMHDEFCQIVAKAFNVAMETVGESEMLAISEVGESVSELKTSQWKFHQTPKFTQAVDLAKGSIIATVKQGRYCDFEGPEHIVAQLHGLTGQTFRLENVQKTLVRMESND